MARPLGASATPPVRGGRSWIPISDVTFGFTTVFIALLIALVAAFALVPDSRQWLAASDGLISWIATATLTLAVAVGIWAFGRSSPDSRFRRLIPGAAALLLLQSVHSVQPFSTSAYPPWTGSKSARWSTYAASRL